MKRVEKRALLTKIMQGNTSESTKQQLRQSVEAGPVICIIRPGHSGPEPDDEVRIQDGNGNITMPYRDVEAYAQRKGNPVIFIFPDNGRQ